MQVIDRIALILTIVGGLNWGLVGLFKFDLVAAIVGGNLFGLPGILFFIPLTAV